MSHPTAEFYLPLLGPISTGASSWSSTVPAHLQCWPLPFRELDDVLGLMVIAGQTLADERTGRNGRHDLTGMLRQSVFGSVAGYEDVNDADRLGRDPAMRWISPLLPSRCRLCKSGGLRVPGGQTLQIHDPAACQSDSTTEDRPHFGAFAMTIAFEYEFNYLAMRVTTTLLGALTLSAIFNRKIGGYTVSYNV